jgi:hypothetical protein
MTRNLNLLSNLRCVAAPPSCPLGLYTFMVALGGLVVACLSLDPRFAGSNTAEDDEFVMAIKIRSTTSFGGEVKSSVPCRKILRRI